MYLSRVFVGLYLLGFNRTMRPFWRYALASILELARNEVLTMASFDERDVPKVAVVLMGGPLDGEKYAIPRIPPKLEVPLTMSLPLKQPASSAPFARYGRAAGDEPVAGFYLFLFEDCVGPAGEKVLYAPSSDEIGSQRVAKVISGPISSN